MADLDLVSLFNLNGCIDSNILIVLLACEHKKLSLLKMRGVFLNRENTLNLAYKVKGSTINKIFI